MLVEERRTEKRTQDGKEDGGKGRASKMQRVDMENSVSEDAGAEGNTYISLFYQLLCKFYHSSGAGTAHVQGWEIITQSKTISKREKEIASLA